MVAVRRQQYVTDDVIGDRRRMYLPTRMSTSIRLLSARTHVSDYIVAELKLECGPMPNVMAALPNIGGAIKKKETTGQKI